MKNQFKAATVALMILWYPVNGLSKDSSRFDEQTTSLLKGNLDPKTLGVKQTEQVTQFRAPFTVHDIQLAYYSKDFASKYKMPSEFVRDLSPGLAAIEFELKTSGFINRCYFNFLIDSSLPIDKPNRFVVYREAYFSNFGNYNFKPMKGFLKEWDEKYKNYRLSVPPFYYKAKHNGEIRRYDGIGGGILAAFEPNYVDGLDYYRLDPGCESVRESSFQKGEISIALKIAKSNYGDERDYLKFAIPKQIQNLFVEVFHNYDSGSVYRFVKK